MILNKQKIFPTITSVNKYSLSLKSINGQTATELAVFGAVLIFVIGLIIKQMMSFNYLQNQQLKALRMAMRASYVQSEGMNTSYCNQEGGSDCWKGDASRNSASIMVVEDRLSGGVGKYGSIDRAPQLNSAQATHSRLLFMPVEKGETYNVGLQDVYVNGTHFVFSTAKMGSMIIDPNNGPDTYPNCLEYTPGIYPCYSMPKIPCNAECNATCGGCGINSAHGCYATQPSTTLSCHMFYGKAYNSPAVKEWCDSSTPCPGTYPISLDDRFDLDRDGDYGDSADGGFVSGALRDHFSWQWIVYMGVTEKESLEFHGFGYGLFHWSKVKLLAGDPVYDNAMLDVDGDGKLERVTKFHYNSTGQVDSLAYIDYQNGDIDYTLNSQDYKDLKAQGKLPPGFTQDVYMYSYTKDGTLLQIREGGAAAVNPAMPAGSHIVQTTQKKHRVDLIQRVFQLSNDTKAYCSGPGSPTPSPYGLPSNPVELCCADQACCFATTDDAKKTCLDIADLQIYIRSRVPDRAGRRWITDTSADDFVDFIF